MSTMPVILAAAGIQSPFSNPTWRGYAGVVQVRRRPGHPARPSWHNRLGSGPGLWIPAAARMTGGGGGNSPLPLRTTQTVKDCLFSWQTRERACGLSLGLLKNSTLRDIPGHSRTLCIWSGWSETPKSVSFWDFFLKGASFLDIRAILLGQFMRRDS